MASERGLIANAGKGAMKHFEQYLNNARISGRKDNQKKPPEIQGAGIKGKIMFNESGYFKTDLTKRFGEWEE